MHKKKLKKGIACIIGSIITFITARLLTSMTVIYWCLKMGGATVESLNNMTYEQVVQKFTNIGMVFGAVFWIITIIGIILVGLGIYNLIMALVEDDGDSPECSPHHERKV